MAGECVEDGVGRDVAGLPARGERGAGRADEDEELGVASRELVDEHDCGAGLGADDGLVIFGRDCFDEAVLEPAGGVDCAVDSTDTALAFVESATQRCIVGEIGDDGDDLDRDRFELEHALDATRGCVVVAVTFEPALPLVAFRYCLRRDEDE
ncbi:unannotated protein [freshwater metagenome]|uniref:Unannotated protein n=1 Tax=freshwater metagenome TaxID=449393 RepID=A0A6J7JD11_9ZZZZ